MDCIWKIYGYRSPENKWYIGQTTVTLEGRAGKDGYNYKQFAYLGNPFSLAIEKFGWSAMEQNVLRLCTSQEEADYWEKFYINEKRSLTPDGYNISAGGVLDRIPFGGVFCAREKEEIPEHMIGQSVPVDVWYQPPKSPNHYWVGSFSSLSKAAKECGISSSMASLVLRGKRCSYKGYIIYPHKDDRSSVDKVVSPRPNPNEKKRVEIWTRETDESPSKYVATTESVADAGRMCGMRRDEVSSCLHGRRKSDNYIFKEASK